MQNRNIVLYIILSFVTCGIFSFVWYYQLARDFESQQPPLQNSLPTSAAVTLLLYIVTCGLYGIYVAYIWGKATPELFARYGRTADDRSLIYLLLAIFKLDIVTMCVIQNDINTLTPVQ